MSSVIELQADSKDEAICISMLYFNSQAPIPVYDCDELSNLKFPYDSDEVDKVLSWMWKKLKDSYKSIKRIK